MFSEYRNSTNMYGGDLVTDNKPLAVILGLKKGIPVVAAARLQRWVIILAGYEYMYN